MPAPTRATLRRLLATSVLLATGAALLPLAQAAPSAPLKPTTAERPVGRAEVPEDRYAPAGGCYALQDAATRRWVRRVGTAVAATGVDVREAEPFHLQATDLGSYVLYGDKSDFLAAAPAPVTGPAGVAFAAEPSADADFVLTGTPGGGWQFALPARKQALRVEAGGALGLGTATSFAMRRTGGCAAWPEITTNVTGQPAQGSSPHEEVKGYVDAHLHAMAYEFIGGKVRCGQPWNRFGVTQALVDCADHEPAGRGAALETVLSGADPVKGHDTAGWPSFGYWPKSDSLTHEQVYYKWLERSWRGGLRTMTNLLVDNAALCKAYPLKKNSCNEMDGVRLQAKRLRELERYIDAQSGGPGEGWFRIVTDPFQARRVANSGKLAVVMGIEVSTLFDCGLVAGQAQCDTAQIDRQLQEVYDLGVRQMEMANKFDNALTGVTGDGGQTGVVINTGNVIETGQVWQMETCPAAPKGQAQAEDRRQTNLGDDSGAPGQLTGRDSLFGGVLQVTGRSGVAPVYPAGPHCNVKGLSALGVHLLNRMMDKGMLFDPDHMSAKARTAALQVLAKRSYDGVVSSHSWSDDTIYPKVLQANGLVTPYAGDSTSFVQAWSKTRAWAKGRSQYWGIGWGADTNGLGAQGGARPGAARNPVRYPFRGLGGVVVDKQVSGTRTYDLNKDGVAHYGLYPDWVEDLRQLAGDAIVRDLERGAEAYLQTWERSVGVPEQRCHAGGELRTGKGLGAVRVGMTVPQALRAAGQPRQRTATGLTWCVREGAGLVAQVGSDGRVSAVRRS